MKTKLGKDNIHGLPEDTEVEVHAPTPEQVKKDMVGLWRRSEEADKQRKPVESWPLPPWARKESNR